MTQEFTHISKEGTPGIVDVSEKSVTQRTAVARSVVELPEEAHIALESAGWETKKGPVFHTAVLAGTMAAKKCSELIPLCHPIALENCKLSVQAEGRNVIIECRVSATHKTGVEMEALIGATVAALTVYDMCKAFSHEIVIRETRLVEKRGGKSDYQYIPQMDADKRR